MGNAPDPNASAVPHRRRHSNAWQATPRAVKVSIAVCAAVLLVVFFARSKSHNHPAPKAEPVIVPGEEFDKIMAKIPNGVDLTLSKSAVNPATRRIEGVITNTSARPYANVEIVFFTTVHNLAEGSTVAATVPKLGPRESKEFATDLLDQGVKEWVLQSIQATPR